MASRTSCSAGKTILIDPNAFDGHDSVSNVSVPLEDLSISVQLETNKKARTILTTTNDKDISNSQSKISLKFIEGTKIGGQKVLTTRYTDLTTALNEGSDGEDLGITSIDIDFGSDYAPNVTITFVDTRGSSIFQNEGNLSNGTNKYSSFFQLPYPIYSLIVKGYYGMPVEYKLHMLKFNAKFNSKTGNFEIIANFIGYTYAMLSDMLLGYMRACPYTSVGRARYATINRERGSAGLLPILTLDELMQKISAIDLATQKIKATDPDAAQLSNGSGKIDKLDLIKNNILILGQSLDTKKDQIEYRFILMKTGTVTTDAFNKYTTDMDGSIKLFNEGNTKEKESGVTSDIKLDPNEFINKGLTNSIFKGLTMNMLTPYIGTVDATNPAYQASVANTERLRQMFAKYGITKPEDIHNTRLAIKSQAQLRGYARETVFDVIDFNKQYNKIQSTNGAIVLQIEKLRKSLGDKLRVKIAKTIGLDPSIRNIVSVLTTAAEVFLGSIYDISALAGLSTNTKRTIQLKSKFKDESTYDIKASTITPTASDAQTGALDPIFYPWPDYRIEDEVNGLEEKYLGDAGVLDIPSDVDELLFIDELLQAFLTSKKKADDAAQDLLEAQTNWIPVNPLDTRLFTGTVPYKRFPGNTRNDIVNYILIRAFTYMGLSNKDLTTKEIQLMAQADCSAVLTEIPNDIIIDTLKTLTLDDFKTAKGTVNGEEIPVLKFLASQNKYYYNYIFGAPQGNTGFDKATVTDAETQKILPISDGFTISEGGSATEWPIFDDSKLTAKAKNGSLFLTNYTTDTHHFDKQNDGGTYIKIIDATVYDGETAKPLPTVEQSDNVLLLSELQKPFDEFNVESVGFNQFGGKYGIQEYRILNYGVTGLEKGPFMGMFYQDGNFNNNTFNKSNGLGLKRAKDSKTRFDIVPRDGSYFIAQSTTVPPQSAIDNMIDVIDGSAPVHASYGKNRLLLAKYLETKSDEITYPYINFQVAKDVDDDNFGQSTDVAPVSLFGSRLYYEQVRQEAKALLFLHTFPWNGLVQDEKTKIFTGVYQHKEGVFTANEILNTFGNRAGFISAPKLWVAYIGGLLWRADAEQSGDEDPILFKDSVGSFIPGYTTDTPIPTRLDYITSKNDLDYPHAPMTFPARNSLLATGQVGFEGYKPLEFILTSLPVQAKIEFIEYFKDFVTRDNGSESDWDFVRKKLEVFNGDGNAWTHAWTTLMADTDAFFNETTNNVYETKKMSIALTKAKYNAVNDGKSVFDSYIVFTRYYKQDKFDYNYNLELRDDAPAVPALLELFSSEVIIANMSYLPWQAENLPSGILNSGHDRNRSGIYVKDTDFVSYIDAAILALKPADGETAGEKAKQQEHEIFGTDNENIIKLQLYRTCKNLYDKWVGGTGDGDTFFQGVSRNPLDFELARSRRVNSPSLIDSFRFVNRSFGDIGDDFIVNPIPVGDMLINNPNSSLYEAVTSLLSANHFDFIPLPSFINYNDDDTLKSIFKPISSNDAAKIGSVGPSFVCVYAGQGSKHLNINGSQYTNDGIDFACDDSGNLMPTKAKDFTNPAQSHENNVAVFAVNYSQQNQSIFKDITLDQSEFGETAESIQTVSDIASKGSENRKTFGGQNLYNIHSVRTYNASVDMMGNVMIQPMMYFQLNNIPMFHGAYLITHVKHSIKPNSMTTNFTGHRIRNVATKLIDTSELFMSLLESVEAKSSPSTVPFGTTVDNGVNTDTDEGVVRGEVVSNVKNNYQATSACKAPSKQVRTLAYYTRENPGPNITSTKITRNDLINYLNKTNLSISEKRATYAVAVLEQGKSYGFNAFGNNVFGYNVEDSFAGLDVSIKEGELLNVFCYGDKERGRVFPQFSQWTDSVKVFTNHTVHPRFIEATRKSGFEAAGPTYDGVKYPPVNPSLNFYLNGIKDTDPIELQALKFTVLYFMSWNSPNYKTLIVNSIGNATNPVYLSTFRDPLNPSSERHPSSVYNAYKDAAINFK